MGDLKELADEAAKELLKAIRDQAPKASDLKLLQLAQAYSLIVSAESTCAPRIRSSRPSPPSGCAPKSPRAPDRGQRELPWPTSSSTPPKRAGGRSTRHTWSPWSVPVRCSIKASYSNDRWRSQSTRSMDLSTPGPKSHERLGGGSSPRSPQVLQRARSRAPLPVHSSGPRRQTRMSEKQWFSRWSVMLSPPPRR